MTRSRSEPARLYVTTPSRPTFRFWPFRHRSQKSNVPRDARESHRTTVTGSCRGEQSAFATTRDEDIAGRRVLAVTQYAPADEQPRGAPARSPDPRAVQRVARWAGHLERTLTNTGDARSVRGAAVQRRPRSTPLRTCSTRRGSTSACSEESRHDRGHQTLVAAMAFANGHGRALGPHGTGHG